MGLGKSNKVDGITNKMELAIVALISEPTIEKAAAAAKTNKRTIYRWMQDPTFIAMYRKARREAFRQAISLTQRYTPLAVQTLAKVMVDGSAPHAAKVAAAAAMLKFGRDSMEIEDLAARVEDLERAHGIGSDGKANGGKGGVVYPSDVFAAPIASLGEGPSQGSSQGQRNDRRDASQAQGTDSLSNLDAHEVDMEDDGPEPNQTEEPT